MPALTPTHSRLLAAVPGLSHGFTSKEMPKSEREAADLAVATAIQVHKDGILWVTALEKKVHEADAIATFTPNLPVGVYSADCVPTLVAAQDEKTKQVYAVLAVHGGWRSTALGLAGKALKELARETALRFPGRQLRFAATIGPCISFEMFEVHDDVVNAFPGIETRGLARLTRRENGRDKFLVDLPGENLRQLKDAARDLKASLEVDPLDLCTVKLTDRFPSYRRRDREAMGGILSFLAFAP